MDLLPFDILSRWIHVGTAVVLLGGSVFMRFVLMPSAETLPDAEHAALRDQVRSRWKKVVMAGIALLLITGFFNYVRAIKSPPVSSLYHALIGTKMLLSFAVFFLASALVGRSAAFEGIRRNSKKWLLITIVLAFIVTALAGVVKVVGRAPRATATAISP